MVLGLRHHHLAGAALCVAGAPAAPGTPAALLFSPQTDHPSFAGRPKSYLPDLAVPQGNQHKRKIRKEIIKPTI